MSSRAYYPIPPHAPLVRMRRTGAVCVRHILFPRSDIEVVAETLTPPSMHHARCLGWTYGDTIEGGETARTAVSFFLCLHCVSFRGFRMTRPKRGCKRRFHRNRPTAAREIYRSESGRASPPFIGTPQLYQIVITICKGGEKAHSRLDGPTCEREDFRKLKGLNTTILHSPLYILNSPTCRRNRRNPGREQRRTARRRPCGS